MEKTQVNDESKYTYNSLGIKIFAESEKLISELGQIMDKIVSVRDQLSVVHTAGNRNSEEYLRVTSEAKALIDGLKSVGY